jgi:serine O-acetyltransferase
VDRQELNERLPLLISSLVESIMTQQGMKHLDQVYLPNRETIRSFIWQMRELVFPGFFGKQGLTSQNITYHVGELVTEMADLLFDQVRCCLRYRERIPGQVGNNGRCEDCDREAAAIVHAFFDRLPAVRELLATDVQAAFDSDPAAQSADETIFCYPGLFAIFTQRLAHEFYQLAVPLLPRIMTEYAHSQTGIDIHPGAKLGKSFFIDHGTGVVIGETTEIGNNVKIYQGVTLGAVAPAFGQSLRGTKRHPTIEDDVTIYAGATILGGETVIGKGALIGGNVFIAQSVPAMNRVTAEPPRLNIRARGKKKGIPESDLTDFQI